MSEGPNLTGCLSGFIVLAGLVAGACLLVALAVNLIRWLT